MYHATKRQRRRRRRHSHQETPQISLADIMMDRLKPSTENLINYMAVGGIVLTFVCLVFPPLFFQQTSMEYLAQLRANEEWRVHEKLTTGRLATLDFRKQEA